MSAFDSNVQGGGWHVTGHMVAIAALVFAVFAFVCCYCASCSCEEEIPVITRGEAIKQTTKEVSEEDSIVCDYREVRLTDGSYAICSSSERLPDNEEECRVVMVPAVTYGHPEDAGWQTAATNISIDVGNIGDTQKSQCISAGENIFRTKVDIRNTDYINPDGSIAITLDRNELDLVGLDLDEADLGVLTGFLSGSFIPSTGNLPTLNQDQIDAGGRWVDGQTYAGGFCNFYLQSRQSNIYNGGRGTEPSDCNPLISLTSCDYLSTSNQQPFTVNGEIMFNNNEARLPDSQNEINPEDTFAVPISDSCVNNIDTSMVEEVANSQRAVAKTSKYSYYQINNRIWANTVINAMISPGDYVYYSIKNPGAVMQPIGKSIFSGGYTDTNIVGEKFSDMVVSSNKVMVSYITFGLFTNHSFPDVTVSAIDSSSEFTVDTTVYSFAQTSLAIFPSKGDVLALTVRGTSSSTAGDNTGMITTITGTVTRTVKGALKGGLKNDGNYHIQLSNSLLRDVNSFSSAITSGTQLTIVGARVISLNEKLRVGIAVSDVSNRRIRIELNK